MARKSSWQQTSVRWDAAATPEAKIAAERHPLAVHYTPNTDGSRPPNTYSFLDLEVCFERFHVEEELPFVVHRSASEDLSVAHGWLERRRCPQLERLRRLDIVVAVDENGRRAGRVPPLADDNRVAGGRIDLRRHTDFVEGCIHPLRRAPRVGVVVRLRAHARDAEKLEQLVMDARIVVGEKSLEIRRNGCLTASSVARAPNSFG
jgi:hypothetical protein